MVMASFLQKLSSHFSFGQWLLCSKLVRYLHPTDAELRNLAGIPKEKVKGRKPEVKVSDSFTVPRNLDIQLETSKITPLDAIQLHYYTEYQWLLDFSVCALVVYTLTEVYYALLRPTTEFNLSLMWCVLVVLFCLKIMFSLTAMYFRTEEGGESITILMFGFFFLIVAMAILIIHDEMLEFGLEKAHQEFSDNAWKFLRQQGIDSSGPASLMTFRIVLAIVCAVIGAFLTFPGLRLAKMHADALQYAKERPFLQVLLHVNIIFPLFVLLMWLKPVFRKYLVKVNAEGNHVMLTDEMFESARILVLVTFCALRFCLLSTHLQAHLNMAVDKVKNMKKETGRISSLELQRMVARVFYYLCVVALQYVAPLITILFLVLMMKTLGGLSWVSSFGYDFTIRNSTSNISETTSASPVSGESMAAAAAETISNTAAQFTLALSTLRQVFTPQCFHTLFSFLTWWICAAWFITSAFGTVYYSYFNG